MRLLSHGLVLRTVTVRRLVRYWPRPTTGDTTDVTELSLQDSILPAPGQNSEHDRHSFRSRWFFVSALPVLSFSCCPVISNR